MPDALHGGTNGSIVSRIEGIELEESGALFGGQRAGGCDLPNGGGPVTLEPRDVGADRLQRGAAYDWLPWLRCLAACHETDPGELIDEGGQIGEEVRSGSPFQIPWRSDTA